MPKAGSAVAKGNGSTRRGAEAIRPKEPGKGVRATCGRLPQWCSSKLVCAVLGTAGIWWWKELSDGCMKALAVGGNVLDKLKGPSFCSSASPERGDGDTGEENDVSNAGVPECIPCPANGVCDADGRLQCNPTFVRQREACVRDSRVMQKAGQMAEALEQQLAELKGEAECGSENGTGTLVETDAIDFLGKLFLPHAVAQAKEGPPYDEFLQIFEAMKTEALTALRVHKVGSAFYVDRSQRPWACVVRQALDAVKWTIAKVLLPPLLLGILIRALSRNRGWWRARSECVLRAIETGTRATPTRGPTLADLHVALINERLPTREVELMTLVNGLVRSRFGLGDVQQSQDMRDGTTFFYSKRALQQIRAGGGPLNAGAHAGHLPASRNWPLTSGIVY